MGRRQRSKPQPLSGGCRSKDLITSPGEVAGQTPLSTPQRREREREFMKVGELLLKEISYHFFNIKKYDL